MIIVMYLNWAREFPNQKSAHKTELYKAWGWKCRRDCRSISLKKNYCDNIEPIQMPIEWIDKTNGKPMRWMSAKKIHQDKWMMKNGASHSAKVRQSEWQILIFINIVILVRTYKLQWNTHTHSHFVEQCEAFSQWMNQIVRTQLAYMSYCRHLALNYCI